MKAIKPLQLLVSLQFPTPRYEPCGNILVKKSLDILSQIRYIDKIVMRGMKISIVITIWTPSVS